MPSKKEICFDSETSWKTFLDKALDAKGFDFKSDDDFSAFETVQFSFSVEGKSPVHVLGQIVLKRELDTKQEQLFAVVLKQEEMDRMVRETQKPKKKKDALADKLWGEDAQAIAKTIKELSMAEKVQLSLKCGQTERNLLMKEKMSLWPYLLKNPKISLKEVASMAKKPQITSECLLHICKQKDWVKDKHLKLSLVKNPKLPQKYLQQFMATLNDQQLIRLAKSNSVKESVSREARKLLAKKGKTFT